MKDLFIALLLTIINFSAQAQVPLFEMWFTADGAQHHGLMVANETENWKMRVKFYDRSCSCTRLVEQKIKVQYDERVGAWLNGSNAKNVYTGLLADFYIADNFFMITDEYGKTTLYNVDDQGLKTKVTAVQVDPAQKFKKYEAFGW